MGEQPNGAGPQVSARIEIVLFADGQMAYKTQVPSRFVFNAMMETAKQNAVADFIEQERNPPKVVLPEIDRSQLKF